MAPLAYGAADVDLVTGAETSPNITQSETFTWANPDNPNQIVVAYNDSRGRNQPQINISGASVSTDGGTTFTRLTNASGQSPFANTFGDPVVLYNKPTGTWFTIWLDAAAAVRAWAGTSPPLPGTRIAGPIFAFTTAAPTTESLAGPTTTQPSVLRTKCTFPGTTSLMEGASESASPLTTVSLGPTSDSWPPPAHSSATCRSPATSATGDVYIAGMNEGAVASLTPTPTRSIRSTDGGNTWTNTYTGPAFPGPGVTTCPQPLLRLHVSRHGWLLAAHGLGSACGLNGVVHYVYASSTAPAADPGDVYYIRSTDSGVTFSAPFKLNTDTTTRPQWQPNLSVSPAGTLFAVWYDARESANCQKGNPAVPCYQNVGAQVHRQRRDLARRHERSRDVVTPLPGQPDPGIIAEYAGDYDYGSALAHQARHCMGGRARGHHRPIPAGCLHR